MNCRSRPPRPRSRVPRVDPERGGGVGELLAAAGDEPRRPSTESSTCSPAAPARSRRRAREDERLRLAARSASPRSTRTTSSRFRMGRGWPVSPATIPCSQCEDDRLHPVAQPQLHEDVGDVSSRSSPRRTRPRRSPRSRGPRDEAQHLELTRGELVEPGRGSPRRGRTPAHLYSIAARRVIAGACQVAGRDDVDRFDELLGRFKRKPLAPAWRASHTYSSRSKVVRMRTCGPSDLPSSRRRVA